MLRYVDDFIQRPRQNEWVLEGAGVPGTSAHSWDNTTYFSANTPSGGSRALIPGTPEHKAQRWVEYQANPDNANWSYQRWESNYEYNMRRAQIAQARVESYATTLDWGSTIQHNITLSDGSIRCLDITDFNTRQGVEFKSGRYFYRDSDILEEIRKDAILVQDGWDIEWVFEVSESVSQPLLDDLAEAGISVRIIDLTE
jgi:hypothetical protein